MQKFSSDFKDLKQIEVEKPDKHEILNLLNYLTNKLKSAKTSLEAFGIVREYFHIQDTISTIFNLIYIKHTCDTRDEKYSELSDLMDEISPEITSASTEFITVLLSNPFRQDLENTFGKHFFDIESLNIKTTSKEVIPDLIEENKTISEYVKLIAQALIEFRGEKYPISKMSKFTTSLDRQTRKEASEAVWAFYQSHDAQIGDIYDRLVKIRTRIAQKLGYKNFVQLGYNRMGRLDWTPDDAQKFRQKVLEHIVPVSNWIYEEQKNRLGYQEDTRYYDYNIF